MGAFYSLIIVIFLAFVTDWESQTLTTIWTVLALGHYFFIERHQPKGTFTFGEYVFLNIAYYYEKTLRAIGVHKPSVYEQYSLKDLDNFYNNEIKDLLAKSNFNAFLDIAIDDTYFALKKHTLYEYLSLNKKCYFSNYIYTTLLLDMLCPAGQSSYWSYMGFKQEQLYKNNFAPFIRNLLLYALENEFVTDNEAKYYANFHNITL